jgi:putative ABC transport system permease protein
MLQNYIKTAWRNLLKNRFYSLINITGLTVGLSVGILILLWVQDERSYDRFHRQAPQIYRLENRVGTGPSRQIWTQTAAPIGMLAKKELPQVKEFARMCNTGHYDIFKYKDKVFNEQNTAFADPSLFSVFDFPLIKGNKAKPFPNDHSIVLTESMAKKYFGEEEPIGKVLSSNNETNFTVSGVIKDFPENSSINRSFFMPMSLLSKRMYEHNDPPGRNLDNDFHEFGYETYLLLQPGVSLPKLSTQLRNIHLSNKADDTDIEYLLLPLAKMHLYNADGTDAGIGTVKMFALIALVILAIACINYVNLSTARSMLRAKEVSLRKIVGAAKWHLFMQFMIETALLFFFAAVLSVGLMYLLMPLFNEISGKHLAFRLSNWHIWQVMLATITCTLVVSSIYPALLLSSFEPLKALKGKIAARISDVVFRKTLVVVQFAFSIILVVGTLVINKQMHYIRSKELGFEKEHVFGFFMRNARNHYDAVKAELLKEPGITAVTWGSTNIVDMGSQTGATNWDGKQNGETMMVYNIAVDKDFIPFFKIAMAEGRNFTGAVSDSSHFILNEAAVKAARLQDPVGKRFQLWQNNGTIIGVVKDFHFASMKRKIEPAVFYYKTRPSGALYIKTTGNEVPKAIAAARQQWDKYNAGYNFDYSFLDDVFNRLYTGEQRTGTLFNVFSGIAILISCLGLLGLATYTAQIRTREIGIRKVLGASVAGIIQLLTKDFIKLVIIAIVIAVPVAWYAMNKWLQDFVYRIDIGYAIFVLAGAMAILVALITISFQSVKSAWANPAKILKTE